ncbi:MAG: flagellar basal body L-ring protein FlgH [Verrucomicrobiota bacterium]
MKTRRLLAFLCLAAAALAPLAGAQSLWRDDLSRPMYSDKIASGIGDIVTIAVQESTTTSKDNKTATTKQSNVDASIASFLYSPGASGLLTQGGQMPALKYNYKNDFAGGGTINNSEKIVSYVAARVIDVLPNRSLVIEGRRETAFGGEQQTIILRGVVRIDDISSDNTVFSYNIADASIHIIGKGTITDSQRKGWFNWLWDKVSPF